MSVVSSRRCIAHAALNLINRCRSDRFISIQLVDEGNTCSLLGPGAHVLLPAAGVDGPHCGLVPLQGPARAVTTSGLRWNLSGQPLQMGVFVSVCNQLGPGAAVSAQPSPAVLEALRRLVRSRGALSLEETLLPGGGYSHCLDDTCHSDGAPAPTGVYVQTSDPLLWTNSITL